MLEDARRQGVSDKQLLEDYPGLTAEDLAVAWAYVKEHRGEIDAAIESNLVA
jgi:uncharacterized protein (DUF433 family)